MDGKCTPDLLVVDGGGPLPGVLQEVVARHQLTARHIGTCADASRPELLAGVGAVLITGPEAADGSAGGCGLSRLLDSMAGMWTGAVVLSRETLSHSLRADVPVSHVDPERTSADELWGRLSTMLAYRPLIQRIEREIGNIERMERRLNHHFAQLDQEMQLASRLQHDFLPRQFPEVGRARFASVFRPASWVSGDIFDVFRLDERHVGFYVADAVGHGVAAGLLTMFIKRSIWTKQIYGAGYALIGPDRTLAALNESLVAQNLPNAQFVTACYCLLNIETLAMSFARAGHPYPIHITRDGRMTELRTVGGLLGVFPKEEFPARTVQLAAGDKVVLYSDGVELGFVEERHQDSGEPRFKDGFRRVAPLPAGEMAARLGQMLDGEAGSLNPQDDVTIIVLEITA